MKLVRSRPFVVLLLAVAVFTALALFLFGPAGPGESAKPLPENAVARVGGETITRAEYERALEAVAADKRDPLDEADRRRILERLVNEALLIRYGLELDLVRQPPLRQRLVREVLERLRAEAEARRFDEAEVRAFYEAHPARFRGPDLLHVRVLRVPGRERAEKALAAWRGGTAFAGLRAEYDEGAVPVPDGPVPADKLRDYLGAGPVEVALALEEGEIGGPVETAGGFALLRLVARRPAATPPLAQVEEAVRHEMRRRAAEDLMAERLAALRERYGVVVADDVPPPP